MHGDHRQAAVEQPLDQKPVRALDGDQLGPELEQSRAQRGEPALVVAVAAALQDPPLAVDDAAGVLLAGPVDPSETTITHVCSLRPALTVAGGEVPWRVLTDGALTARLPVAARGTSTERREALVSCWPSARASDAGALPTSAGTKEDDQ
jgi:hypothetical protein